MPVPHGHMVKPIHSWIFERWPLSSSGVPTGSRGAGPTIPTRHTLLRRFGSREHIGRLKKQLESALQDEWFMTTNISAHPVRPVGVGAIVHCSLAKHMTDCVTVVLHPDAIRSESEKQDWARAVDGPVQ